jgi:hypothetical protein
MKFVFFYNFVRSSNGQKWVDGVTLIRHNKSIKAPTPATDRLCHQQSIA